MKMLPIGNELRDQVAEVLRASSCFAGLAETRALDGLLAAATLLEFEPGEEVVRSGQPSDSMFLLVRGKVAIQLIRPGCAPHDVGRVSAPYTFGEIGLLLDRPRAATVTAFGRPLVLRFDAASFLRLFDEDSAFRLSLTRTLAERFAEMSEVLTMETSATVSIDLKTFKLAL